MQHFEQDFCPHHGDESDYIDEGIVELDEEDYLDLKPFEHTPLICEYAGESRPGFRTKDGDFIMLPQGLCKCRNPVEYKVSHKVDWETHYDDPDLENCKGIDYDYKSYGEHLTTTLYPIQVKDPEYKDKYFDVGYYSNGTVTTVVFKDDISFKYQDWMDQIVVLCMK